MPTFNNTNELTSTIDLYFEGVNYRYNIEYPPSDLEKKPYVDHLYYEFVFYGRVDSSLRPRVLNANAFLKPVFAGSTRSSKNRPIRLVNPVADAANAFFKEYELAYSAGNIDKKDPFLAQIKPIKGYVNFTKSYNEYIKIIFSSFVNQFAPRFRNQYNDLRTFEDFMRAFKDYNLSYPQVIVTPSSYLLSRRCDPFVSGLMVSIADIDPADNKTKYEDFIRSPNAVCFRETAIKHGFSVDKNKPWVLIADLKSPAFAKYISEYDSNTEVRDFFNDYYFFPYSNDIDTLRNSALNFYNGYVRAKKNDVVASCGLKAERIVRTPNDIDNLKEKYGEEYWLDFYADLKIKEMSVSDMEGALKKEIKKMALDTLRLFDLTKAVNYVNFALREQIAYKPGSYHQEKQKIKQRQRNVNGEDSAGILPSGVIQSGQMSGGGSGGSGY